MWRGGAHRCRARAAWSGGDTGGASNDCGPYRASPGEVTSYGTLLTPHSSPIYSRSRVRENWAGRNFQKHSSPLSDRPPMNRIAACALGVSLLVPAFARAQSQTQSGPSRQTEGDAYTRYELLAPGSAKFRIIYEVTATTPGAMYYFNPIRKGSVATDESVSDRATGKPLVFDVVSQAVATAGGVRGTDSTPTYIRAKLSRPVPADGGEAD